VNCELLVMGMSQPLCLEVRKLARYRPKQYTFMHYDSAISFDKNLKRNAERMMFMVREEVQERVNQDVVRAIQELDPRYQDRYVRKGSYPYNNDAVELGDAPSNIMNYEDLELFEVFDGWGISPHGAGLATYPATDHDLRQEICAAVCEASGWDILDCQRRKVIKPTEVI
jgi:hypothetical protein